MRNMLWLLAIAGLLCGQARLPLERVQKIDRLLEEHVNEGKVAGVVALVLRDGKPVYEKTLGWSDKESGRKMTADTLFRIASQSKAITSAAIMQLVDDGKILPTDPVGNYIPSFKNTMVAVKDASGARKLEPARRPITIAQLLTHTSGMSYGREPLVEDLYAAKGLGPAAGNGWYTADKDEPICVTMERLGTLPVVAQPGEAYVYGYNTDILGCVVEKASGMPFDEYLQKKILGPLGMKDTRFYIPAAEKARLATLYASGADGKATRAPEGSKGQGHYVEGPKKSFSGGAGLTSTARDYARFLDMVRRGGEVDGVRILSPRAAKLMTSNQAGTLHSTTGLGFGYGFETVDRYGADGLAEVGAFGWGGAYGTRYQVDPKSGLVSVIMIQLMPNTTMLAQKYMATVYQTLVE